MDNISGSVTAGRENISGFKEKGINLAIFL
jgi:hypothetical protein